MQAIVLTCFILIALSGAFAAPLQESVTSETPTTEANTTVETPTQEQPLEQSAFNCSVPGEGAVFMTALGSLKTGLRLLRTYSSKMMKDYPIYFDISHETNCDLGNIRAEYPHQLGTYTVWASMAVLTGYAEVARQALESAQLQLVPRSYMQGVQDVVSAVLEDYGQVLAHEHCDCTNTSCSNEIVLNPSVNVGDECKPYPYVATNLKTEVIDAQKEFHRWADTSIDAMSTDEWLATHLSSDSPAYESLQI